MTKKLEEFLNLTPLEDLVETPPPIEEETYPIQSVEDALTISEKINTALAEVRGMESHDKEMDEIALEAMESYKQLMALGHNMTDMASGQVFTSAVAMLKVALDAKDSKVSRKLKQVDLMLKKARLDQQEQAKEPDQSVIENNGIFDRNELLKIVSQHHKKDK